MKVNWIDHEINRGRDHLFFSTGNTNEIQEKYKRRDHENGESVGQEFFK